ncbi:MAG: hypothetical protein JWM80_5305 [Cyanobacteria bacterium RYN_339]|nr:hypothetical protein [Cyanobacteria bacterium RYN_339]
MTGSINFNSSIGVPTPSRAPAPPAEGADRVESREARMASDRPLQATAPAYAPEEGELPRYHGEGKPRTLSCGDHGHDVKAIQQGIKAGLPPGDKPQTPAMQRLIDASKAMPEDGKFEQSTEDVVKLFQHVHRLPETGVADGPTQAAIAVQSQITFAEGLIAAPALPHDNGKRAEVIEVTLQNALEQASGLPIPTRGIFQHHIQDLLVLAGAD